MGVVRRGGGTADVTVFWPDGGSRVLSFEKGLPTGSDRSAAEGDASLSSERQNDLTLLRVGPERFEVPDAVLFGD